jgi:hypothetical protein
VLKRSWAGEVRNVSLLVAIAVNGEGYREILGTIREKRVTDSRRLAPEPVFVPSMYDTEYLPCSIAPRPLIVIHRPLAQIRPR